ncbi:cyclohexanecarboxylate-CoA ligase [Achromobacter sp. NFACC18-2]|uniref:cyclohexanecarboxylate-CoA ligase n=1 Tax=Achromobacter sp. NFACC18-2 TaxID=1564112 RepID=UPI0008B62661|nr:cyclohexanecarboxylate-CoA ligase [Achromobacter sp. NFACC18-2]SEJ60888.1 cyclohexanecarboxylate-CoA ligase [Achromobacter sp. NFACC18-2]
MEFDAVLIAPRRAESIARGWWPDRTINDLLDDYAASRPEKIALTAVQAEQGVARQFTSRELASLADRVAVGLARLGVGRGDVVACQLPNGWQFVVTYLACSRIGAVMNPLMHIFRQRELSFMLHHSEARVLIIPDRFRGFDYPGMVEGLRAAVPALEHVIVVGGAGPDSFEVRLSDPAWEREPDAHVILTRSRPGPDDVTQLMYTSGTTGEPKGVMHTANTCLSNIAAYAERLRLGPDDVVLMGSPMAHQTGFMYGLMMPFYLQASAVTLDIWNAATAARLMREHGVTFSMASTPFLTDIAREVAQSGNPVPTLRTFLCAGAPIPGPLVEQASRTLGAKIISAWGMTENGAVTLTLPEDADERACTTDGRPLPGVEIKVTDASGTVLPAGQEGCLWLRSASNFGGYLKRPQLNATDADGWFDTGDMARIDADGYLRITGRSKDVIIRGGENIPVVEIESLLYRHPAVESAAIVAYPDERLGERACAVVTLKRGQQLELAALVGFLKGFGVAVQYIPERLEIRDALPTTPSGKVQKFRLRQMLADASPAAGG